MKKNAIIDAKNTCSPILDCMKVIYNESRGCKFSQDFFSQDSKVFDQLHYLSQSLKLSPFQVSLLTIMAEQGDYGVNLREICSHTDCLMIDLLSRKQDFQYLVNRGFVTMNLPEQILKSDFIVSSEALDCWSDNIPFEPDVDEKKVYESMIENLTHKYYALEQGNLNASSLKEEVQTYLEMYKDFYLTKRIYSVESSSEERWPITCVLLYVIMAYFYDEGGVTRAELYKALYDSDKCSGSNEVNSLIESLKMQKYIRDTKVGKIYLTKRSIKLFSFRPIPVDEDVLTFSKNNVVDGKEEKKESEILGDGTCTLIHNENIKEKELFYNQVEAECLNELLNLISPDRFGQVVERMSKNGMRTGFNCLLYGTPGTGKTEFVYQLARRSGRSILKIDFSELRNRYIGESEKAMRRAFFVYRKLVEESEIAPILLINECDGLLGRRVEVTESSDQLNNACQAILLEELENLKGISISTSNVPQRMDEAFERRFLYKIEIHNPDESTRKKIWQSVRPALSESEASELAGLYKISGGQIENVARKVTISNILMGVDHENLETLKKYCETELLSYARNKRTVSQKIGFSVSDI